MSVASTQNRTLANRPREVSLAFFTMSRFMTPRRRKRFVDWLKSLLPTKAAPLSDIEQARRLVAAVDRGGIPLNAAKVNAIARNLGLEVSTKAPVAETIERLRQAVARAG